MVRTYLKRPEVQAFLQRPRVTPILLFAGLGVLTTFLRSLVINPAETATLPLLDAGHVLLRLLIAGLGFAAVLWAIRPGERGRRETAVLILGTLVFSFLVVWADRPAAVLMVAPIVARYWLTLRQTLGLFAALFAGSLLIYILIPPLPTFASPQEWFGLLG